MTWAGQVAAVRAAALVRVAAGTAGQAAVAAAGADGVYRAEAWRGQRGEHARMRGHGLGDAFAAGQPGPDDLPGVALVHLRARRADVSRRLLHGMRNTPPGSFVVS